jgi:hypothetical protein
VLEHVIHRNNVVLSDVARKISRLEGALDHVVTSSPTHGRDVRLDLDTGTFQIDVSPQFVEVPAVPCPHIEDSTR